MKKMKPKTYDRIKRWIKRHKGAYFNSGHSNSDTVRLGSLDEVHGLERREVVKFFNNCRNRNVNAVAQNPPDMTWEGVGEWWLD